MESYGEVWVWAEQRNNRLMPVSLELLNKGHELSEKLDTHLAAVLIASQGEELAKELIAYGAKTVYLFEDPRLDLYQSGAYTKVMAELIKRYKPEILLLGATHLGLDLAARVAARVQTGLTAHCVDLQIEKVNDKLRLVGVVPGFGGNLMVKIVCPDKLPQMATVKPGVLEKPSRRGRHQGKVINAGADIEIKDEDFGARTVEMVEKKLEGIPLEEADIVVAGGWGLCSAGSFKPVEDLAAILGGAVAGTRPAVDKGWVPAERMIGQSGKTISPTLFISIGASGAMHFTTGFLKSKVIMAINQDRKAPIFEVADIGLVGDLCEVTPCLIEELKKTTGQA